MKKMTNQDSNEKDTIIVLETKLKNLETKLKNAEVTMANNRIVIESLVKTQGCLKDTLIEALCKLADIESDLF